tara:strand:- start:26345 stop:26518 length:174 start_codon:yes stop_codon:yes gene_type:complete
MTIANINFDALSGPQFNDWLRKAELLQSKGYPVEKDVYKLAKMMYNGSLKLNTNERK